LALCSSRPEDERITGALSSGADACRARRHGVRLPSVAGPLLLTGLAMLAAVGCASGSGSASPTVAATPGVGDAARGKNVFTAKVCIGCHQVSGEIAGGMTGPDLRGFGSRPRIAAVVPNTPENLWHWLENPQRTKPGTLMPRTPLTAEELDDLVAYQESLK
jgi:cytochrome c1